MDTNDSEAFEYPSQRLNDSMIFEQVAPGKVDVFVRPIRRIGLDEDQSVDDEPGAVMLLQVDVVSGLLTMFPMRNLDIPIREVEPKYGQIERISFGGGKVAYTTGDKDVGEDESQGKFLGAYIGKTKRMAVQFEMCEPELEDTVPRTVDDVMGLLEGLPRYCVREPRWGLGLRKQYRAIVGTIEALTDAKEIRVSGQVSMGYEENTRTFTISDRDMLQLTKAIERVDRTTRTAANTVNETSTYNTIADVLGVAKKPMRYGRTKLRKALTAVANDEKPLSGVEQAELVETLTYNVRSILKRKPATMEGFETGIAIARARDLHDNFTRMMKHPLKENNWQKFLQGNPFILSMVFGRPIVKLADQASVGGRTISGGGDKIADFLVKNSLTNNAALVEIKTPNAKLLNKKPYRVNVFVPAGELVGAINQALDQKNKFEQDIAMIRNRNRSLNVEAHHVQAFVLAGTMPTGDDRLRSFELFRHNLKDVVVMTFDELMRKVEDLCTFLEGNWQPEIKEIDLPF